MKTNFSHLDILKKLFSLIVVMSMLINVTTPVFAQENLEDGQQEQKVDDEILKDIEAHEAQKARYEHAIQQMEQYIYVNKDGLFQIDVEKGSDLGIDEALFLEFTSALAITNEYIASGKLTLEEIAFSDGSNIFGELIPKDTDGYVLACAGWTGEINTIIGPRLYLNHCHTGVLTSLMFAGSGASGLCAFFAGFYGILPLSAVCAFATGILVIGGHTINGVNALGGYNGVWFQTNWNGNIISFWHQ